MIGGDGGLVDTRVLGKPDRFYGDEAKWEDWHTLFESWAGPINVRVSELLGQALKAPGKISYDALPTEMRVMTKLVFHVLLNLCRGRAAVMVRRQKATQNGFEAYRYLGGPDAHRSGDAHESRLAD